MATVLENIAPAFMKIDGYFNRHEARRKYREYKEVAGVCKDRRYIELANVYKHLAMGHKLISMTKAMEIGGVKSTGLPVLAIANARANWVWYEYDAGNIHDADGKWRHSACGFVSDYAIWTLIHVTRIMKYGRLPIFTLFEKLVWCAEWTRRDLRPRPLGYKAGAALCRARGWGRPGADPGLLD